MYKSAITELLSRRVKLTELYGGTFVWGNNDAMKLDEGEYYRLCDIRKIDSPVNWVSVACGSEHTLAIKSNGELWAWGSNGSGRLGIGNYTNQSTPQQVGTATNWVSVVCGYEHTLAINASGELYAWGSNGYGQLGIGNNTRQSTPQQVGTAANWVSVAGGGHYTMAINSNGELYAWGDNTFGQLGLGDGVGNQLTPQQVGTATNWVSVVCGYGYTLAINSSRELWAWGQNDFGQLGIGNTTTQSTPQPVGTATNWVSVDCGHYHTMAINASGALWAWGYNYYGQLGIGNYTTQTTPHRVGTATNWVSVACGKYHTMAINSNREIWTCGQNTHGQLGTGNTVSKNILTLGWKNYDNWISLNVSANADSSYAINSNGELWCYGSFANTVHTLPNIANIPIKKGNLELVKIASGNNFTIAAKADGTPVVWGDNSSGQLGIGSTTTSTTTYISDIYKKPIYALGRRHTMVINTRGELWAWGANNAGQLGIGHNTNQPIPERVGTSTNWVSVACGANHTVAVNASGELWAWGYNGTGQLGLGYGVGNPTAPRRVGTDTNWVSVACGEAHTMAINASGKLWAWGSNGSGRLGIGNYTNQSTPQQVGTDTNWVSVACGYAHTVAIKSNGQLWAWGDNYYGQLGIGNYTTQSTPQQVGTATNWVSVACGEAHTMAINASGKLWVWGYNNYGQLGIGTTTGVSSAPRGVGTATNWVSVACGAEHILAVNASGELWTWGNNGASQLGLGHTYTQTTPERVGTATNWVSVACGDDHTMAINANGELWVWGNNAYGQLGIGNYKTQSIPYLNTLFDNIIVYIKDLACGYAHTVAIDFNGWLWAWGHNNYGQLGLGNYTTQPSYKRVGTDTNWVSVACGYSHTLAIKSNGELWAWGYNADWQLGLGPTQNQTRYNIPMRVGTSIAWRKIAAGYYHSAAIKSNGELWAWGYNGYGQLGLDTTTTPYDTPQQVGTATNWVSVACGAYHTMAINSNGELWAWGRNENWQLGVGQNTDNVISPVRIAENNIWVRVICGTVNTVAIDILNHVYVCGDNTYGQLGLGAVSHQYYLVKIDNFSCTAMAIGTNYMVAERVWSR